MFIAIDLISNFSFIIRFVAVTLSLAIGDIYTWYISWKIIYLFYWLVLISRRLNLFKGDICNRYTCPLQASRHFTLKIFIQDHPWSAKVPPFYRTLKLPMSPLLLVPDVWHVKPTYRKSWAGNALM